MWVFALSSLRAGLRSHSFLLLLVLGCLGMGLVLFVGLFSSRHLQTVQLDVGLSVIRAVSILMVLFWVQDLLGRDVERKAILFSLAYPVPRSDLLFGRYLGVLILAALGIAVLTALLFIALSIGKQDYVQPWPSNTGLPLVVTLVYFWVELALVAAVATALAAISTTPFLPFALGGLFAICAKSIGPILDYVRLSEKSDPLLYQRMHDSLTMIHRFLPDTSRLDFRAAALYNQPLDSVLMFQALLMAVAYIAILLGLASAYFDRREFA